MQSISVKVNDSVQTIVEAKVITKDGQPTVIRATRNANYELINDATGRGPDHIVTKRVGKDLHISFEENAEESDLIIENFYDHDKSALIGQAESGQYHYYVPDTGLTQDYVTELVIGDIEGQALGGQGYPAPWWIGAEEGTRFGIMPWLVGIAGLAGIAAAISGRDDKGNDNNNNANASAQEKPLNIENIQSDTVAQGATQALNFTVTSNGQNVSQAIISVNGTELKDANNKTVLTDKDGKVNITAQLLEANGIKLGELHNFTISAKKEHYTEAKATLHNPEVVTMDGGVVVTPHESATELEVTYTKPDQTVSTAKFTKNTNGDGKAGAWIDNNKDDSVTIDPATGKVVIPVNTIGSKTNVTAKQTTDVGTTNNSEGVGKISSAKPVVEAIKTGDDAGNVVIKPSDDATTGSKVVVSYTDADGKSNTATITKDNDGKWTSNDNKVVIGNDGTITIPADNVTDGSDVSATQTDPGREESLSASDRAKTSVPQPKINANDDGSVTVTPSDKANKVTINYTDEDGKQNTATIAKDNNGKWTSNDDKVVIGNDGSIILPDNNVKDGSEVSANQTVGTKDSDKGTVTTQDNVPTPEITANDDGSVTVTPSDKANKVTINYTDEDGKQNTATIAKDNNGKWTSNDDKVVIGNDGSITIPADKVKDGSTATAEQTVGTKDSGKVPVVVNNQNGTTPAKPASPEINANDDGSVTVTPSDKANKVTINYTDEDGKQNTATIAKDNNGKWTSNDDKVVIGNDGNITIPADKVKDGSTVTTQQTTPVGISDPADATAKDGIAEPDVTANPDGSVTVKPTKDATKVEISYVDEDDKEQTVTVTKDKDGNWTADDDNVVINDDGTITLPADKVKDGSDVTANQTTDNGKSGDAAATATDARADAPSADTQNKPTAPAVTGNPDGTVDVKFPSKDSTEPDDTVKVTATPEGETVPVEVTYTKQPDGTWKAPATDADKLGKLGLPSTVPADKGGQAPTVSIPADKVADNTDVTATVTDTDSANPEQTAKDTAKTPAPSADTQNKPTAPAVTGNPDGTVDVKFPSKDSTEPDDTVKVTATPEGETVPVEVTYTKQPDGTWKAPATDADKLGKLGLPSTVPADKGGQAPTVSIPADKVADNTDVTATVTDTDSANPEQTAKDTAKTPADTNPPTITVDIPATEVEAGETITVTFTIRDDKATSITDFDESDIVVEGGVLKTGTLRADTNDPLTYTAKVTVGSTTGTDALKVSVDANKFSDGTNQNTTGGSDTATVKAPVPPVVSINVSTDNGTAGVAGKYKTAVEEDGAERLVYTISLDKEATSDLTIHLTKSGKATNEDFESAIPEKVVIEKGKREAKVYLDAKTDTPANMTKEGGEGNERLTLSLAEGSGYKVNTKAEKASATGVVIDSNAFALTNLGGSMTTTVGPTGKGRNNQVSPDGYTTTEYADKVYIGYAQDGTTRLGGPVANIWDADVGGDATVLDTAGGDDYVKVRLSMNANTIVNLGDGNDTFILGAHMYNNAAINAGNGNDYVEIGGNKDPAPTIDLGAGDDRLVIGGTLKTTSTGTVLAGEGNDSLIVKGGSTINLSDVIGFESMDITEGKSWIKSVTVENLAKGDVKTMTIDGDANDRVYIGTRDTANDTSLVDISAGSQGNWVKDSTTDAIYDIYTNGEYTLKIDKDISIY
ncbi:hypothetical protein B5J94_13200 [Moraxella lacunata]|uniref:Uncharacterized protein n=3 Tax=Moraxella lacunata TaxID=477 RepID=A0A1V4GL82_MORLA|nr:hypothetical protein [Moraxella lacunata]OPH33373.1 hypothetical protein B5J94_13200 [Moraxella lacunata]